MKESNNKEGKLGVFGTTVQVDEKMVKFKCKSHSYRPPENKTDTINMLEVNQGV